MSWERFHHVYGTLHISQEELKYQSLRTSEVLKPKHFLPIPVCVVHVPHFHQLLWD